ncbi:hypothetical protein [Burkholderia stagnalis]|nr:hypothetical protein [Burkholderia stagnalis]
MKTKHCIMANGWLLALIAIEHFDVSRRRLWQFAAVLDRSALN